MDHIQKAITRAKKEVAEMEKAGIYKPDHIQKVRQEKENEIAGLAKEWHENNIMELKKIQNDVIRKHDPTAAVVDPEKPETKYKMTAQERYKHLPEEWRKLQIEFDERRGIFEYDINGVAITDNSNIEHGTGRVKTRQEVDLEVNQKLLESRRLEAEIRAAKTGALEAEVENISTNKSGNIERINLIAGELRARGKHEAADQLLDYAEAYNVKQPWKNDPDYIAAAKQINEQQQYANNNDLLFIDESGDRPLSISNIWKETEKEQQAKHDQEVEAARADEGGK